MSSHGRYERATTAELEQWSRHPRDPEDARRIREELRNRNQGLKDTGTMSLFGERPQEEPK